MIEIWCIGCRQWFPIASLHGWNIGRYRVLARRVRWTEPDDVSGVDRG